MKALAMTSYGLDNVEVIELPEPAPAPGQVAVVIGGAALNHLDLWTLSGSLPIEHEFPHVLGADGAGVVTAVGEGVKGFKAGTKVMIDPAQSCGACEFCRAGEQSLCTRFAMMGEHTSGTFAEVVVVSARNLYPVPAHLDLVQTAALGTTFITAYRMLFTRGRLRPGEWVLITGIGGGLALSALQLARAVAGRVFVTSSSPDKLERARELGADEGIDYSSEDVGKAVRRLTGKRGVDLVIDSAGGSSLESSMRALRKGGRLVNAGATAGAESTIDVRRLFWNQLELIGSTMGSSRDVSDMLRLVAGTRIEPIVDRTFSLDEGAKALAYLKETDRFGKVALSFP